MGCEAPTLIGWHGIGVFNPIGSDSYGFEQAPFSARRRREADDHQKRNRESGDVDPERSTGEEPIGERRLDLLA